MRLVCHLRVIRGGRPLRVLAVASGVDKGSLSRIERGVALPTDAQVPGLQRAYGVAAHHWYEPAALLAIQQDETA